MEPHRTAGTINPGTTPNEGGYYSGDWKALNTSVAWIKARAADQLAAGAAAQRPFFAYQGMDIVHPAYFTNAYWHGKVNESAVDAPAWKPLAELHPCDYQVRCAFFDRCPHSRMPLSFTPLLCLKLLQACDQWHSSRASTPTYRYHRNLRPNTAGIHAQGLCAAQRI
jgi:hypothetical protein